MELKIFEIFEFTTCGWLFSSPVIRNFWASARTDAPVAPIVLTLGSVELPPTAGRDESVATGFEFTEEEVTLLFLFSHLPLDRMLLFVTC